MRGTRWVGTSFKMTKLVAEAREFAATLAATELPEDVQAFVIPSFTAIAVVKQELHGTGVRLGAQNAHWEDAGSWTGEVSIPQLKDVGIDLLELGHSERRQNFGETDETVNLKAQAALRHDVTPLICFGEPAHVLASGDAAAYVARQVAAALEGIAQPERVLLAYEPIWAIGDAGRPATPSEVARALEPVLDAWGDTIGGVLYGGSVNADNAAPMLAIEGVTGLFVGRAAWDVMGFLHLIRIAAGA